ncbi:MAG TPA: hypothetical protein PKD54_07345 [Pirellulaceae bacterium]|nr:hypothetical protein [Pirellulaceae bacterium]
MLWHRLLVTGLLLFPAVPGSAQQFYRWVPQVVYEDQPITASRWVTETQYETQQVTEYRGEWVDEPRQRRVVTHKPVRRERVLEERYSVLKPVTETSYEERTVQETVYQDVVEYQQRQVIVNRPVIETIYQDQQHVVRRPVTQQYLQNEEVVTYKPQTTTQTYYLPATQQVVQPVLQPGATTSGLQWLPRGYYYDPALGQNVFRRGGLHWTQNQAPPVLNYQATQVPVLVPQQSTQTVMVPELVRQQRPVEVTTYQDVIETRKVPVQVQRTEQVVQTETVPVTVRKPVIQQRVEKVVVPPRYEQQEVVRRVPFVETVYEPVEEVEYYTVRVFKSVPEVREVQVPRHVQKRIEYQTTQRVARTVWMKVPTDACGNPLPGPAQVSTVNSGWQAVQSTAVPGSAVEMQPVEYRARPVYQTGNEAIPEELRQYRNPVLLERRVLDATNDPGSAITPTDPMMKIQKPVMPSEADRAPEIPPVSESGDAEQTRSVLDRGDSETGQDADSEDDPRMNGG